MKALPSGKTDAPALPQGNPCMQCGGRCCSFTTLRIALQAVDDKDRALDREEKVRATLQRGASPENLYRQSGDPVEMRWYTNGESLFFDCQHLTVEGKCGIYDDRPSLCRDFECAVLRGEEPLPDFLERVGVERTAGDIDGDVTEVTDIVNDELERLAE